MTEVKISMRRNKTSLPAQTPEERLRALVDRWTSDGLKKHRILDGAKLAVEWYVRGGLGDREVSSRAKDLAKAASKFTKELKRSEPFWLFMAQWAPKPGRVDLVGGGSKATFTGEEPWLPTFPDILMRMNLIEAAAAKTTDVLHKRTRVPDAFESGLGIWLARVFRDGTGKQPGFSSEGTAEDPRSDFGNFVALVLRSSPHENSPRIQKLLETLPSFVKRARNAFVALEQENSAQSELSDQ